MNWKDFEKQAADIFGLIGYEVTHDVEVQSAQTDILAISKSRFKPNLVVECKYHAKQELKVSIDEVENFSARVVRLRSEGVVDQGYLVTNTGFSSPAKGSVLHGAVGKFVFLVTYEQLLQQLFDADFYLKSYVQAYEQKGEHLQFVELTVHHSLGNPELVLLQNAVEHTNPTFSTGELK